MAVVHFCSLSAGLIPTQLKLISVLLLWSELAPVIPLHQAAFVPSASCTGHPMTRPRGRPRRGSPWKPRRPSITPPDSTSADSSPRHQSDFTPVSLQAPQFSSMAIIPRTPISLLRLFQDSPAIPPNPVPSHDPLGNLGCGPSPQGEPKRVGLHFRIPLTGRNSEIACLYCTTWFLNSGRRWRIYTFAYRLRT
jgi:hypothetical protein